MRLTELGALRRAARADHGILATLRPDGRIDAVPACFALEDRRLGIPVDRLKPKVAGELQRERNVAVHREATFLCEGWQPDDWSRLWWVRLRLEAEDAAPEVTARLEAALRARYRQYANGGIERVLVFRIVEVIGWSAT